MNVSATALPSLAVRARSSRASARLSAACPASSCSAFARGSAALRVKRAAAVPAAAARGPTCSLFGISKAKSQEKAGAAWSLTEDAEEKSKLTIFDWIQDAMKKLRTPALALALVAALAMAVPDAAHAAKSGGRVGGSSFRR